MRVAAALETKNYKNGSKHIFFYRFFSAFKSVKWQPACNARKNSVSSIKKEKKKYISIGSCLTQKILVKWLLLTLEGTAGWEKVSFYIRHILMAVRKQDKKRNKHVGINCYFNM